MAKVTITAQEKALLNLISEGESTKGADPYTSLWPGTAEPALTQMTCAEVQRFQAQRIANGFKSSACGRYQFIKKTLKSAIDALGIDPLTTCYTPDIQDALILAILKKYRGLDKWIAGDLATDKFMIKLAQEFASFPVPYDMKGQKRQVTKGQSYYAGDGLNKALHDADTVFSQLNDIRNGGTGKIDEIDIQPSGPSGARPILGDSPKTQIGRSAAGPGVGAVPGTGRPNTRPAEISRANLPGGDAVYVYDVIDPLDDRYDFRIGKKIKDLLIHGADAAAASPVVMENVGPANVATTNTGVVPPSGSDPDATDPRGRNQIPTDVTTTSTETDKTYTTTVTTIDGPRELTREQILQGRDNGSITSSNALAGLDAIQTQELEARKQAAANAGDTADPDSGATPSASTTSEQQQQEAVSGNAPPPPPPPPTKVDCVKPVTVETIKKVSNNETTSSTITSKKWTDSGGNADDPEAQVFAGAG